MKMEKLTIQTTRMIEQDFEYNKYMKNLKEKMEEYDPQIVELIIDVKALAALEVVKYCTENNIDIELSYLNHQYKCHDLLPFKIDTDICNSK